MIDFKNQSWKFTILTSIVTALIASATTLFVSAGTVEVQEKTLTQTQIEYLLESVTSNYQYEQAQRKACEEVLTPLELKVRDLENKVDLLVNSALTMPFPHWLKGLDGTMLALNAEYERIFLTPRGITKEQYIGSNDFDIWPEEFAAKFRSVDQTVQSTGGVWIGQEWVLVNDSMQRWQIVKYPARIGKSVIGIGGFAIPPKNSIYFPTLSNKDAQAFDIKQPSTPK